MEVLRSDSNNRVGFFYQNPEPLTEDFETKINGVAEYNMRTRPGWQEYNIIGGHFTFGIHTKLNVQQFKYLGVVRDPVEHHISSFKHFLRASQEYQNHFLPGPKTVETMLTVKFMPNLQTFFLSGLSMEQIRKDKERAYSTVVENTEKYFAGVYPTEQFDEGLFYFKHKIGIKPMYYHKKNVAANALREKVTDEVAEKIRKVNDVDVRLFEYFKRKFDNEFSLIPLVGLQLAYFKLMNNWVGPDKQVA